MKEIKDYEKLMSCCPGNRENFSFLVRLMRRNVVVPFFGAGFSANFGYPVWREFLENQVKEHNLPGIGVTVKYGKYERAASELYKRLGEHMEYVLIRNFGDQIYKVESENNEMEEIPKIFQNLILTTNFDEVIEMLYAKVNGECIEKLTPKTLKDVKVSYKRIACGEPTLIKLHGDVAMREFVLTEQEYDEIYGKSVLDIRLPLPSFLRDVLLSKIILFMGCSLEDDRTLQVIKQSQIDGSISFALLELPDKTRNEIDPWTPIHIGETGEFDVESADFIKRKAFLNAHNIIPIWYPKGEHVALKIFIKALAYYTKSEQNLSVTVVRNMINNLLSDGNVAKKRGNISQAFYSYAKAEEIIERNFDAYTQEGRLQKLEEIKEFYDANGYIYECRKIRKNILVLTRQAFHDNSVELAMCYHDIGYAYERYLYYELMLKAMERSWEILQRCDENLKESRKFINACAFLLIGLGYAYLKNDRTDDAKKWYEEAKKWYDRHKEELDKKEKAFMCNGLYRYYYDLKKDEESAIQTLEEALVLRKGLFTDGTGNSANHLVNTYSNKIKIYLGSKKLEEAREEYKAFEQEQDIWKRIEDRPGAKRRILETHGDILVAQGQNMEAYNEYQRAIQHRKYLHFAYDKITAEIYLKMADCLINTQDKTKMEKAMQYMIQSYVIYEKLLGEKSGDEMLEIKQKLSDLGESLSLSEESINMRLEVQGELMKFLYDERMDKRQEELIQFFEL